jgi:DNA-binding transcriptional ArsR family regulator
VNTYQESPPEAADVLAALGDPTRRRAFELLAERPMAVGDLASRLPVSRPAVSQHLKALKQAGLVEELRTGTRRVYSVRPEGVEALRRYLDGLWTLALDRFAAAAEDVHRRKPRPKGKTERRQA